MDTLDRHESQPRLASGVLASGVGARLRGDVFCGTCFGVDVQLLDGVVPEVDMRHVLEVREGVSAQ